jgi:DNA-binding MarR family transcriptional regulator
LQDPRSTAFRVFNEIGIINQLAAAMLARRLPDGVHRSQFFLLGNLMRLGDGKTPVALAQAFQVPKASMTNTLMQLEKRGLIDVRPHPGDKRKKQVFLTDAGRALYVDTVAALEGPVSSVTADVEGLESILPVLQNLRIILDANRGL